MGYLLVWLVGPSADKWGGGSGLWEEQEGTARAQRMPPPPAGCPASRALGGGIVLPRGRGGFGARVGFSPEELEPRRVREERGSSSLSTAHSPFVLPHRKAILRAGVINM